MVRNSNRTSEFPARHSLQTPNGEYRRSSRVHASVLVLMIGGLRGGATPSGGAHRLLCRVMSEHASRRRLLALQTAVVQDRAVVEAMAPPAPVPAASAVENG